MTLTLQTCTWLDHLVQNEIDDMHLRASAMCDKTTATNNIFFQINTKRQSAAGLKALKYAANGRYLMCK